MASLFIVGNGFDLSHGLETSYEHFHCYLKETYPDAQPTDCVPEYLTDNHGNEVPTSEDEVVGFIEQLLCDADGDKWSDLETAIGEIDFDNYLPDHEHDEDDDYEWDEMYFNENCAMALVNPILEIPSYFNDWISTIDVEEANPKKSFLQLIDKRVDLFLSFNYTPTLEMVYGIEDVCHIHGVQGERLLFGHGETYDYFSDDNYGVKPGTEDSFQQMHDQLKKDTYFALKQNLGFFKNLSSTVDRIYSYGFSFSKVDEIYIKEVCKRIDTNGVIWYLNSYDNNETQLNYQSAIRKCGFKGDFDSYNITD